MQSKVPTFVITLGEEESMTRPYDWNAMPHKVDVICPECSAKAVFEFAEIVKISKKQDIEYFKKSKVFDYQLFENGSGQRWHGAIFYHGLHSMNNMDDLPDGYSRDDFRPRSWDRPLYTLVTSIISE
jgi:hypothetical protein